MPLILADSNNPKRPFKRQYIIDVSQIESYEIENDDSMTYPDIEGKYYEDYPNNVCLTIKFITGEELVLHSFEWSRQAWDEFMEVFNA